MNRFFNWLIALSMVAIASSLAAVLYMKAGLPIGEAGWIGVAALLVMVLGQFVSARARERSGFIERLEDLSTVTSRLAREVGEVHERLGTSETRLLNNIEDAVADKVSPLTAEIRLVETLVRQVADTLASGPVATVAETKPAPAAAKGGAKPEKKKAKQTRTGAFAGMDDAEFTDLVRDSVNESRMEIHLQPIVTLPQRKVRYYEALTRLKSADGKLIMPEEFLETAEGAGLMPLIDNMMLYRSVQVVRRLQTRNREFGLFCNIASQSLADAKFFEQFAEFMEQNKALAPLVVFEFSQKTLDLAGPIEHASLDALAELGFRFSMDRVTHLDFDAKALADQKVRFVKIPAALLLSEAARSEADIDPADLHDLLARDGIDLIVDRIERESDVVDLLDYDVTLGQGELFSPPRPVRADVLSDIAAQPVAHAV